MIQPIVINAGPLADHDHLEWRSNRHRTAIGRVGLSMPARQALNDGVLDSCETILDYGSGRGQDVKRLRSMGRVVQGWDPHFAPETVPQASAAVLLTYVLNVIDAAHERVETLKSAWRLTGKVLVVSARLTWDARRVRGEDMDDGVLTSRGTFQHLYSSSELRSLVEQATGARCVNATPGVVYAFRDDTERLAYLARRAIPDFNWDSLDGYADGLSAAVRFAESRGRIPIFEEFPAEHLETLGRLSPAQLTRLVNKGADPELVSEGVKRSTLDTLLFLGIELFNGRSCFSSLPLGVQLNIRKFFRSYRQACQRSDRLLLKLRDDTYVRGAMRNSVGKLTPSALYVHKRAASSMPVILRLYEHCGSVAAGIVPDYTLIKLSHDRRAVSWLGYPDFDSDPHPRTAWSYQVNLSDLETKYQDFQERSNRPLLHRKEEFVGSDDQFRDKYERLTKAEVAAGLYKNPQLIGTEDGWERELTRCGVSLRGHRLIKRKD